MLVFRVPWLWERDRDRDRDRHRIGGRGEAGLVRGAAHNSRADRPIKTGEVRPVGLDPPALSFTPAAEDPAGVSFEEIVRERAAP